jgi:hypothetical protein
MPTVRYIDDFCLGDNYRLYRTLDIPPDNSPVSEAWWTLKEKTSDPDAVAAMQIHITTSGTSTGAVINNTDGTVLLKFTPTPNETTFSSDPGIAKYYYDIQVLLADGEIYTLEIGKLFLMDTITKAL